MHYKDTVFFNDLLKELAENNRSLLYQQDSLTWILVCLSSTQYVHSTSNFGEMVKHLKANYTLNSLNNKGSG